MNLVSFSPHFEKMRNFMLDVEKHFEPMSYVAQSVLNSSSYPPHNIYKNGDKYYIEIAVAGFDKDALTIEIEPNILTVKGNQKTDGEETPVATIMNYIHKGISSRKFTRVFYLSEFMKVTNTTLKNGLLTIEIERVLPEEMKKKNIEITYIN